MLPEFKSIHYFTINLSDASTVSKLHYDFNLNNDLEAIPSRLVLNWGNITFDTGFRGSSTYNKILNENNFENVLNNETEGFFTLTKNENSEKIALATLYTPIEESLCRIHLECMPILNNYITNQILSAVNGKNSKSRYFDGEQPDGLYGLDLFLNYYQNNFNSGTNDDAESTKNFVRNPNCWAYDINLTCCSPWNMHPTIRQPNGFIEHGSNLTAGTLISPKHVMFCAHYDFHPSVGATMRFITKDNVVVTRTLVSVTKVAGADIKIGLLDQDVPSSITFAKILPDNYENYLSRGVLPGGPGVSFNPRSIQPPMLAVGTNQDECALIFRLDYLNGTTQFNFNLFRPDNIPEFSHDIRLYDSGSPLFIIIDNEPVLIFVQTSGTYGSNIVKFKDKINNIMSSSGYSLTIVDLNRFQFFNIPTPTPVPTPTPTPTPLPEPPTEIPYNTLYACQFVNPDSNIVQYKYEYNGNYIWNDNFNGSTLEKDETHVWKISMEGLYLDKTICYISNDLFGTWIVASDNVIPGLNINEVSNGWINDSQCFLVPPGEPALTIEKRMILKLDLSSPNLSSVLDLVSNADYSGALQEWKKITLNRLRNIKFGYIGPRPNHIDVANPLWQNVAEFLAGRISSETYNQPNGLFLDIYGIAGDPDSDSDIDWTAKLIDSVYENNEVNRARSSYGQMFSLIVPMIYKYWAENDDTYGKKFRNILVDFCSNQKRLMEAMPYNERVDYYGNNASWVPPYGGFPLRQADRIELIVKALAVFAKKQEYSPPVNSGPGSLTPPWLNIFNSVGSVSDPLSFNLISHEDLSFICLSLTQDHIIGVYNAFLNQGIFNQRVTGLGSLILILCIFPEVSFIPNSLKNDLELALPNLLNNSIFNDGGFIESSFNYNVGTAIKLEDIFNTIDTSLILFDQLAKNILTDKLLLNTRMMESLRTPFLDLPIVGNNGSDPPTNIWTNEIIRNYWFNLKNTDFNIYAYNPPKNIGLKNFTSIAFPYSGYYVHRKNWEWSSPYLFFINSRPINAGGREMANSLSLELHAYGRQLLINGGPPPYSEVYVREDQRSDFAKISAYFDEKSTYKTNTIIVNDLSQSKNSMSVSSSVYPTTIQSKWHNSDEFDYMEGSYTYGYGPFRGSENPTLYVDHTRKIIFLKNLDCWIVVDVLKTPANLPNTSGIPRNYSQIWKFPPYGLGNPAAGNFSYGFSEGQVNSNSSGIYTSDPSGPNLYIYQFSNIKNFSYTKYYGEKNLSTGSAYRGWYARYLGDAIPAVDMYANWSGSGNFIIASLLIPTQQNSAPDLTLIQGDTANNMDLPNYFPLPPITMLPTPPSGFPAVLYACGFIDLDISFDGTGAIINLRFIYTGSSYVWVDNYYGASIAYDESDNLWKISIQNIITYYSTQLYGQWYIYAGDLVPGLEQGDLSNGVVSTASCGSQTKLSFKIIYNSKTIEFSSSVSKENHTCGNISSECEMLLTIEQSTGNSGMVLNSTLLKTNQNDVPGTNGDIEFSFTSSNIEKTKDISNPSSFTWTEDLDGLKPNYS